VIAYTRAACLRVAFVSAIVGLALSASAAAAQSAAPVVTVRAPGYTAGNTTFTGVAVDCASGQPATRVAVYDGLDSSAPYVADVSMDTMANVGSVCPGRSGSSRIGYTLIYNTRGLDEGAHTLLFVAEFPNGATGSTTMPFTVENYPPRENYCSDPTC
jgi:hypothetical protein